MTNIEIISWRLTLNLYIIRMCFNIIIINIIITATTLKQQSINQPTNQSINQSINQSTSQSIKQSNKSKQSKRSNQSINQSIQSTNQPTNQPTHQQTNQSISRSVNHDICIYIYTYHTEIPGRQQMSWPLFQKSQLPRILHPVSAGRPLALHPASHWAAGNVARTSPAHRARGPASAHQDFPGQRPTRRRLHLMVLEVGY